MSIRGFDHVALPAQDPEAIIAFYKKLGFPTIHEAEWRAGAAPRPGQAELQSSDRLSLAIPIVWAFAMN